MAASNWARVASEIRPRSRNCPTPDASADGRPAPPGQQRQCEQKARVHLDVEEERQRTLAPGVPSATDNASSGSPCQQRHHEETAPNQCSPSPARRDRARPDTTARQGPVRSRPVSAGADAFGSRGPGFTDHREGIFSFFSLSCGGASCSRHASAGLLQVTSAISLHLGLEANPEKSGQSVAPAHVLLPFGGPPK